MVYTKDYHASKLEASQKAKILRHCRIGFWRTVVPLDSQSDIHVSPSKMSVMYFDDTMLSLVGLEEHLPPHECYVYWMERLISQENDAQYSEDANHSVNIITYTWDHPHDGRVRFRSHVYSEASADGRSVITEASAERLAVANKATAILSSKMVKTIIENIPVGTDVWDRSLNLVESNPACYKKFFNTKEEYLTRFHEVSPPFQPDGMPSALKSQALLRQAFELGCHSEPWMHQNLDGDPIPTTVTAVKLSDDYVLVFCYDQREEVKIHAELAEAKEKQEILYDNIPLGLFLWTHEGVFECNTHMLHLIGVVDREWFLKDPDKFLPHVQANGEFSRQLLHTYQMKAVQEGYCKFRFTFINLDREHVPTEMTIYSVLRDNRPVNYCFARDLRTETRLQNEINKNLHYMQIILNACPMGVSLWDTPDKPLYFNKKIYKMLGLHSKDDFHKAGDFFAFSQEYQPCGTSSYDLAYTHSEKALENGSHTFNWMHVDIHGNPIPTRVVLVRIQIKGEDLLLAFVHDLRVKEDISSIAEREKEEKEEKEECGINLVEALEAILPSESTIGDIAENLKYYGYK